MTEPVTFNPADLSAEKSLWQIWKTARRLRRTRFNQIVVWTTFALLTLFVIFSRREPHFYADSARNLTLLGINFAATILGFLVAGFTIFATLTKVHLLKQMASTIEPHSKLSYIKYNFFAFFETFGWFIAFAGACLAVIIFGGLGGPVATCLQLIPGSFGRLLEHVVARAAFVGAATGFVLVTLELKSFVFNLYKIVMITIRAEMEFPEEPAFSETQIQQLAALARGELGRSGITVKGSAVAPTER